MVFFSSKKKAREYLECCIKEDKKNNESGVYHIYEAQVDRNYSLDLWADKLRRV